MGRGGGSRGWERPSRVGLGERSWLGMGDAAAQERRYGAALEWYAKAEERGRGGARDRPRLGANDAGAARPAAPGLGGGRPGGGRRGAPGSVAAASWARAPLAAARRGTDRHSRARSPGPPLRAAGSGAARRHSRALRGRGLAGHSLRPAPPRRLAAGAARALHAAGTLAALGALAYVAVYRGGLVGMLLETLRAGPE